MRRVLKKGLAAVLAAAMVVTLAPANADAAKKKTPSVPKKTTVKVGKTKKIKVKNGSKKATVTWKASNKNISIAKKVKKTKGNKATTIKGVKAGTANVTASYKLGKKKAKKLVCKVTVTGGSDITTTPTPAPVTSSTPAPTGGDSTPAPTQNSATPTPVPTPVVTPTPGPKSKNTGALQAWKTADEAVFDIDGKIAKGEGWEDAKEQDLLTDITKEFGVRNGSNPVSSAKAKFLWDGSDFYVLVDAVGEADKIIIYYDENKKGAKDTATTIEIPVGGSAESKNTKYTVNGKAVKDGDKIVAELKISGSKEVSVDDEGNVNDNVSIDIQINNDKASVNYFDTRSQMVFNEETKEFELGDAEVAVGSKPELMGAVALGAAMPAATKAYFTEDGADIIAASGINDNTQYPWDKVGEGEEEKDSNTKKIKFVDTQYWTKVVDESIEFANVNIPSWKGNAAEVKLASPTEDSTEDNPKFKSTRDQAQAYIMWDENYLYVMFDVTDPDISPANDDHYTTDSTEFFLDEDGTCTAYDAAKDAVQLRIDAINNVFSSNDAGAGNYRVVGHAVGYKHKDGSVTESYNAATDKDDVKGYYAQYIIKFNNSHQDGDIMGVELQINDCFTTTETTGEGEEAVTNEVADRACTLTAYDTTNSAYENPELFERLRLVKVAGGNDNKPETGMNAENTIYTVDLTKATKASGINVTPQTDGSVLWEWTAETGDWASVEIPIDPTDFTDWTLVVDATGDDRNLYLTDATRKKTQSWGPSPINCLTSYGCKFPATVKLDSNSVDKNSKDDDDKPADFKNVGKIVFQKGDNSDTTLRKLTVKSIKFYKNAGDIPK